MVTFDFINSLRLASDLDAFARRLLDNVRTEAEVRDSALAAWQGTHGDEVRSRSSESDRNLELGSRRLEVAAEEWVTLWQDAVNRTNEQAYEEARAEHETWLAHQRSIAEIEAVETRRFQSLNPGLQEPANVRWLNDGAPATVERPRLAARPVDFLPAEAPFAQFTRQDYDLRINYIDQPNAWVSGVLL